jgi:riboflavin biosynthesis pyrimidine reductase
MVASADGAAAFESRSGALSSETDHELFLTLRTFCDVVLVGASTVRMEGYGPARGEHAPPIAVVSGSLDLDPSARFFTEAKARPIIVTIDDADKTRRAALEPVADVVSAGVGRVDMGGAIGLLAERGLTRVLTEGGPALLAELVNAGQLHELCLTASPLLASGHSKRILDGPPMDVPVRMTLLHVLEEDGFLYLRYGVV